MTEPLLIQHTAGLTLYASVWNQSGQVFDWNDNTFKAVGSATTPGVALTERTGMGGTGKSGYTGSIDLADINPGGVPLEVSVSFYQQAGGSPAPSTDTVLTVPTPIKIQFGEVGELPLTVEAMPCFTTTAGTEVRLFAKIMRGGKPVPLGDLDPAATLEVAVREHGQGADLFVIAATTVEADGTFELSQSTPGYTADRLYKYTAELVENGNTHSAIDITFVPNLG